MAFNVFRDGVKINDKPIDGATHIFDKFAWPNKQVKYRVEVTGLTRESQRGRERGEIKNDSGRQDLCALCVSA